MNHINIIKTDSYLKLSNQLSNIFPDDFHGRIALAVSGGLDSMSMCIMMKKWIENRNIDIVALTVDHKLRPESTQEARNISIALGKYGIEHHVLTWDHEQGTITSNIQEKARIARYSLLTQWCVEHSINDIFFYHLFDY